MIDFIIDLLADMIETFVDCWIYKRSKSKEKSSIGKKV